MEFTDTEGGLGGGGNRELPLGRKKFRTWDRGGERWEQSYSRRQAKKPLEKKTRSVKLGLQNTVAHVHRIQKNMPFY